MTETIEIGFSPCPNDTFIFDALVNRKIDTGNFRFEPVMEDVETLNAWAKHKKLGVTKVSYGVFPLILDKYALLDSGSALGKGVGPLLIRDQHFNLADMATSKIAIPGENTTAHLLFSLAYPALQNKLFMRYDEIEQFVAEGKGLGVIIHENRFTYKERGLEQITDLGNYWEAKTGMPIPLGGIVVDKDMSQLKQTLINSLIKKSIEHAYCTYPELPDFVKAHAQEMNEAVMRQHIDLYVNNYSLSLGPVGRDAVRSMIDIYAGLYPDVDIVSPVFISAT